jgi:flagellar biosynthesis protein FlhG
MSENQTPARPLRVIAVASGKGGVGKTSLTVNLGVTAARAGRKVLIIDADLGLANAEILLGIKPQFHLGHLLADEMPVEDVLGTGPHNVRILAAGSGVQKLTQLSTDDQMRIISAFDPLENHFDTILIDVSAGIGDNVLFFAGAAQETLLVVAPEPTSLTDAYATVKVLSQEAGVQHFNVVVNAAPHEAAAKDIFQKLTMVTSRFLSAHVNYYGFVPRDEHVRRAIMAQKPFVEVYPNSPASRAVSNLYNNLIERAAPTHLDGGLKFLWQRVLRESSTMAN